MELSGIAVEDASGFAAYQVETDRPAGGGPGGVPGGVNGGSQAARSHVRGSSLMLVGRVLALGLNFVAQVLTVRYLAKSDYGAYTYALAVANIGSMSVLLCLDKAMARFLPVFHEQEDYDRLWGSILTAAATVAALGLLLVFFFYGLQGWIGSHFIRDPLASRLVLLLIAMAPLSAAESLIANLFAAFATPREIFFPRHLLGPVLGLAVVVVFIVGRTGVLFLAEGTLLASVVSCGVHLFLLARVMRDRGLPRHFRLRTIQLPWRDLFGFTLPLLASDLVFVLRGLLVVVLLERFRSTTDVAAFQAVFPVARLNQVVYQSFMVLFMPIAGRLYAREDPEAINELYWNSAVWIAVITFPLLAVSFSLAQPLTTTLYGARYAQSGSVLALLAVGHYFNSALGFNGLTLQVFGKVRYIVIVDLIGAVVSLVVNVLLIARFGVIGAAVGTCSTLVLQNLLYQAGLRLGGVHLIEWRYLPAYGIVGAAAVLLWLAQSVTHAPLYVGLPLAALTSLLVLVVTRGYLKLEHTFPELLRLPAARRFFASGEAAA